MSSAYADSGRAAQKNRTRAALVAAARELVAAGEVPHVVDAARAASVSRATAYRYFPTQRELLLAAHPEMTAMTMLPPDAPTDPAPRLAAVVDAFTAMIVDTKEQQRAMLRLSLEDDPARRGELPLRQGRAIGWFTEALEPLRADLGDEAVRRLVLAIRAATGIEALVWLTDVGGCSDDEARALMRWSAQALLDRALSDPPPAGEDGKGRRRLARDRLAERS